MEGEMKRVKIRVAAILLIIIVICSNVEVKANTIGMKMLGVQENVRLLSSVTTLDTSKYITIEAAANQVRTEVRKHSSKVNVHFKTTISSPTKAYEKFKQELTKETENSNEGDYMYWDIKQEIPNYICIPIAEKRRVYYYYEFHILYDYYTTLSQRKKVDKKVKSIIKNFGFTNKTSNYQKVKTIYEYICKNVQYAYNAENDLVFTSYSALFYGKAVCQGYAQLMYKMLKEVDVPSRLIPGYANGELHGWNIVKIGKYYYNVDVTWDSGNYQRGYGYKNFLKGDNFMNHIRFDGYKKDEFYGKYPMAKLNYGEGKKQLSTKSKRAKFKIKKPSILKVKGKRVTLKKIDSNVKYTIQYATEPDFGDEKNITAKKKKVIITKLKKNRKYYIRYRASKKIDGKRVYTKWSDKKIVQIA